MPVTQGCPTIEPLLFVECIFSFSQRFFPAIVSIWFGNSRAIKAHLKIRAIRALLPMLEINPVCARLDAAFLPRCNKTNIMFLEFSRREGSLRASKSMARGHV